MDTTLANVRDYYGRVLQSTQDLKTSACCAIEALPRRLQQLADKIHPEVRSRFYGCGAPFPPMLEGCTVLDLGCGTGRDVFLLSQLVGPAGRVIGIDMTEGQLEVARRHQQFHADAFGFGESNVQFVQGYIEDLASAGIATNSVDVVVSNCVANLSPDKRRVFSEAFRVLKPGGELYFSDVFADRRIPSPLTEDPVLLGECLGGALYKEDFRRLLFDLGVKDFRVVSQSPITLTDSDIVAKIGMVNFTSITFRVFKLPQLEDRCEDYGQVAYYKGTLPDSPHSFLLDDHHLFRTGVPMLVCSNSAAMVADTRYGKHFRIEGDLSTHYGLFDCGPSPVATATVGVAPAGACC